VAREIVVEQDGRVARFTFSKVDRAKLYGRRQRVPLDPHGERCERAELTADGALLVRPGMTAQSYFDDAGHWVQQKSLVGLDAQGQEVEGHRSTLGEAQPLTPIEPAELLDLAVHSTYALEPQEIDDGLREALLAGQLFRFPFSYRGGWSLDVAVLVAAADEQVYALIGRPTEAEWCALEAVAADDFDDEALGDDLDFEMF
jgi:hypothetical protein